ncbi:MAG: MFS transporter, partial [Acidobacteriales bacterium]|nr:MFS transporter [Terriglobales bacterium]
MVTNNPAALDSPRSWVEVLAAFIGAFVSFGVMYSFGVFLRPMVVEFHASHAVMSTLFATITALSFFVAPFTGELADRHGARPLVATGAVLMGASLVAAARTHTLPLLFLTYGVGVGVA